MIEDFDAHLSSVGVAREGKLDAQLCSARKGIRIVREQYVGHVAADQRVEAGEHERPAAVLVALALIVHANQIERATPPAQLGISWRSNFIPKRLNRAAASASAPA